MQLLLIKISAINANPEYALLGKKQAEDRFTPGEWNKVASLARGRRILLLIPDSDVVLTSVSIPSKSRKQLLQAVPYALEDTLAEDLDKLHFAIHQNADNDNGETQVAVINHSQLELYQSLLQKHGLTAHFVLPQLLVQTTAENAWSIQQSNDVNNPSTVSVRLNEFYGFTCDKSLLDSFLEQLKLPPPEILLSNLDKNELPETLQELPLEKFDAGLVHYKSAIGALPLNVLSGFVSRKNKTNINWNAWRPAMILGSLVAATWVGIFSWQNNQLQQEQKQLKLSIENTFKSTFPDSRLVDAPQQMSARLAQLKKNAGSIVNSPLPMISDISPLIEEYKDMTLSEIRYQENELIFVIQSPNLTRLENFKKDAIEKASLQVEIKSSTTTANKVEAMLIISPLNLSKIEQEKA